MKLLLRDGFEKSCIGHLENISIHCIMQIFPMVAYFIFPYKKITHIDITTTLTEKVFEHWKSDDEYKWIQ